MSISRAMAFVAVALMACAAGGASAQTVRTAEGRVRGERSGEVVAYLGLPFAAPPIGQLRWREPQPVAPWRGVRSARSFAPACVQSGVSIPGEPAPATSEDCLYLNIWRPTTPAAPTALSWCGSMAGVTPTAPPLCRSIGATNWPARVWSL